MSKKETVQEAVIERIIIELEGVTPLISNKRREPEYGDNDPESKRDPVRQFIDSIHWVKGEPREYTMEAFNEAIENGAIFGFPARGFRKAAASAGHRVKLVKNAVETLAMFSVVDEYTIINAVPIMRHDTVCIGRKVPAPRYRAEFTNWSTKLAIDYNAGVIPLAKLLNVFNHAGFSVGVGDWRPEKGGDFGKFRLAKTV